MKKYEKRTRLLALLLVLMLCLTATGCSSSSDGDSASSDAGSSSEEKDLTGTLRVQLIGDYYLEDFTNSITGEQCEGLHVIVEDFEEQYPGATLEFIIMGWDDYVKKTQTMILANEADVYQVPGISQMADMDVLEPLQPYIDADDFDLSVYLDGQIEGWMIQTEDGDEPEIYSLPFIADSRFTGYDKEIFDQWGVEYLSEYPTVEEVLEKAAQMTGINPVTGEMNYGVAWRGTDAGDLLVNIAESLGGSWGDGFRFDELTYNFNSDEFIQAAEIMLQLQEYAPEGVMSNAGTENWGNADNTVAIYLRSENFFPSAEVLGLGDQYGASYTFLNPDTGKGSLFVGSPFAIGNTSENKDLAWEFLKYVSTDFVQEFFWENFEQLPCTTAGLSFDGIDGNENMTVVLNSASTTVTPRYPYRASNPRYILTAAIESIMNGTLDVQEALDGAQADSEEWTSQQ